MFFKNVEQKMYEISIKYYYYFWQYLKHFQKVNSLSNWWQNTFLSKNICNIIV